MKKFSIIILTILSMVISGCSFLPSMTPPSSQDNTGEKTDDQKPDEQPDVPKDEIVCHFNDDYSEKVFQVGETFTMTYTCMVNSIRRVPDITVSPNLRILSKSNTSISLTANEDGNSYVKLSLNERLYDSVQFNVINQQQDYHDVIINNRDELLSPWSVDLGSRPVNISVFENSVEQYYYDAYLNGNFSISFTNPSIFSLNINPLELTPIKPGNTAIVFSYYDASTSINITITNQDGNHGRSAFDPLSVAEARHICYLNSKTDYYFVGGYVTCVTIPYLESSDNMYFYISDSMSDLANTLLCNGVIPNGKQDDIYPGNYVVIDTLLSTLNGECRTERGATIYSTTVLNYPNTISSNCANAVSICSGLSLNQMTTNRYQVTGYVCRKTGSSNLYVSDDPNRETSDGTELYIYAGRSPFKDALKNIQIGDKITATGFLTNVASHAAGLHIITQAEVTPKVVTDVAYFVNSGGPIKMTEETLSNEDKDNGMMNKYYISLPISEGILIYFKINDTSLNVSPFGDNNNLASTESINLQVLTSSAQADIYLYAFNDGSYGAWASGYVKPVEIIMNAFGGLGGHYEFSEMINHDENIEKLFGSTINVSADDTLYFLHFGTQVTVYADGDLNNIATNNGNDSDMYFHILTPGENLNIYFEIHKDGTYHVWVSGYIKPIPEMRIDIDGVVSAMDKVSDGEDESTGKLVTYHFLTDLSEGQIVKFINSDGNNLTVTPYTDNNNFTTKNGNASDTEVVVGSSVIRGEIWIDIFKDGTNKVYASGYQPKFEPVVFYKNGIAYSLEDVTYPKDPKAQSGYYCLADIGVGDTLFFKQGDNNITFRTEGYNNSAYLTNGETEGTEAKVNCFIKDADVYLYNYGDYLNLVIYGPDETTIQFGYYPQSLVTDTELISNLNSLDETSMDAYGYYQYGNERYAKLTANYNASFPSGTQVNQGDTCWFLFQPINWRIVEFSNGKYTLLSDVLLDISDYYSIYSGTDEQGKYANDYEHSYVRSFLNSGFYSVAFSLEERQLIASTTIDNSAASTGSEVNPYACQNTTDNVSILSYADLRNPDYGFVDDSVFSSTRICHFSDYAMMKKGTQGAPDVGQYWTRSPYATASDCVNIVNDSGQLTNCMVGATAFIRPVIVITQL